MIDIAGLVVKVGSHTLLDGVHMHVPAGQVWGLIGPNGAGKSTLLGAVSGDVVPAAGQVRVGGLYPSQANARELARVRAVMLQDVSVAFQFLVRDIVAMGRRPWSGISSAAADDAAVEQALHDADLSHLAARDISTLSGGERARVALARVLAQDTPVLLLDEPTAALDIKHQEQVLSLVRRLAREKNVAVLMVLHDLNAAANYCDGVVCLAQGKVAAQGTVEEVLTDTMLSSVYGWPLHVGRWEDQLVVQPVRGTLA